MQYLFLKKSNTSVFKSLFLAFVDVKNFVFKFKLLPEQPLSTPCLNPYKSPIMECFGKIDSLQSALSRIEIDSW